MRKLTNFGLALLLAILCVGADAIGVQAKGPGGLATVALSSLPPEARATLARIKRGGPFRYRQDGSVFGNRERHLPSRPRGYYREYTVPTPGAKDRGARRIVAGGDVRSSGEYYYTEDHYNSFRRIKE